MKTKDTAEKKPRTIDPAIAELRAEHQAKIAALKSNKASAKVRQKIESLLPKLTNDDKTILINSIKPQ